jgi:hypothetical protein
VAEEVKLVLKPHYNKKHISKEEYKEILRKAVPKVRKRLGSFGAAVYLIFDSQIRFATTRPAKSTFKKFTLSSRLTSREFATKESRETLLARFNSALSEKD